MLAVSCKGTREIDHRKGPHEDERITSRVYGHDGIGLKRLAVIIEKIEYPGLRLPTAV
jgi:hypothetical protein